MPKPQRTRTPRGRKGRSKAEAMTGAKEGEVEVRQPAKIGDNSQLKLASPEDFSHHMKAIKGAKEKLETSKSLVRHAKDAANKTCKGMAAVIEEVIGLERKNDPQALAHYLQTLGLGLKQIDSPIQITIFDTLAGDVADQAYKRGFADGEAGRSANNQYPGGSDLHEEYQRGWSHGTAKNLGVSSEKSDEALAGGDAESGEDEEETEIPDAA